MAYAGSALQKMAGGIGVGGAQIWRYDTTDGITAVEASGYFTDGADRGMRVNDIVFVFDTDASPVGFYIEYVSAVNTTTRAATIKTHSQSTSGVATFTDLTATGDVNLGNAAADALGFHGATAVTQRASSVQVSTNVVTSASYGTLQVAQMQEVYNTLAALGLWKGAA
jgi:hypothetical protein